MKIKTDLFFMNTNLSMWFIIIFIMVSAQFPQTISLDGSWSFVADQLNTIEMKNIDTIKDWRIIEVPSSWHIPDSDLMDYQGIAWYKKNININNLQEKKRYILHFDAVDYLCSLYVNRKYIGMHEGGYTPFQFDISEMISKGRNEILLKVNDPKEDSVGTEGISYWNIPHGKQSWYVQNSGIWQSVYLSIKEKKFVKNVKITPRINGEFSADILLDNREPENETELELSVISPAKEIVFSKKVNIKDQTIVKIKGEIKNSILWDVDNPKLYSIKIDFGKDIFEDRFGFREFENREGKFYLNGKPFYMIAALDQDFYPETVYITPSEEFLIDEMKKAKNLGLNTLRCHIKIPDPRYFKVADELGLLIWYEIPNWDVFNSEVAIRASNTMDEMLARDWNHPSLVVLSIINESWGIDLNKQEQRDWLKNEFDIVKAKATGRLVVDNSACWGNFHLKTDINDYHTYWAIPENYKKFSQTVNDVAQRPKWLFSNFGDAEETGNEILMISEFGNWGLPKLPKELPFWFNRKFGDAEVALPEGVHQRFIDYKYKRIFSSYDKLADASQSAQFTSLKYEIEEIRLQKEIQGYVITEFSDINWESNGLLDFWRNYKIYHKEIADIQKPDIIIPRSNKFNFRDNEEPVIKVYLSHYSCEKLDGAKLIWKTSDGKNGILNIPTTVEGDAVQIGDLTLKLESVSKPEKLTIQYELVSGTNKLIAKNFTEIFVYPSEQKFTTVKPAFYDTKNTLSKLKDKFNGRKKEDSLSEDNNLIIANSIDEILLEKIKAGAYIICLVDSNTSVPSGFPVKLKSRNTEWLDGNWASNLNWIVDKLPPFNKINFGNNLGFESADAIPDFVIADIPAENFEDVLAGMYVGWIHKSSGYFVQMSVGKGKLIITSFKLKDNYLNDPYSTYLLDEIINYVNSKNCKPKWNYKF